MKNKEYEELENYLAKISVETLAITDKSARLRIKALIKSNILSEFNNPDTIEFKIAIDTAMRIPQIAIE